uniref:Aminotransferase-like plant mobile domain-containing protein n=1 Tax=Fagus sylvatica TaxID=28930 RepID=A0A2N9FQL9_FAGSY
MQIGADFGQLEYAFDELKELASKMSSSGGDGGRRRSSRLEKGKEVVYASSPDTNDEYKSMEGLVERASHQVVEELQHQNDAGGEDMSSTPSITIQELVQPSATASIPVGSTEVPTGGVAPWRALATKRRRASARISLTPEDDPEHVVPGKRYPPEGGIRPKEEPTSQSSEQGSWFVFHSYLAGGQPEYHAFQEGLGFRHFLNIPNMSLNHRIVRAWYEQYFHHIGTFHLSTCEMGVLPLDWSAILGIRFGGRIPPREHLSREEVMVMMGIDDPRAFVETQKMTLKVVALKGKGELQEPLTDVHLCHLMVYFISSCFLGEDQTTIPLPFLGMFRDLYQLHEYGWRALTYGFYLKVLHRFSRRETSSLHGFWQFTIYWVFEHFLTSCPSLVRPRPGAVFLLARRWDATCIERLTIRQLLEYCIEVDCIRDGDIFFQPYGSLLSRVVCHTLPGTIVGRSLSLMDLRPDLSLLGSSGSERDDLTYSRDEAVRQLHEHLARMSTSSTAPIDGAGTSTQGPTSSLDIDFRGWLDGDFDGLHGLAWLYMEIAWLGMALFGDCMAWHVFMWRIGTYTSAMPKNRDLCLHAARDINMGSGLTPRRCPRKLGLMPAQVLEGSGLTPLRGPRILKDDFE